MQKNKLHISPSIIYLDKIDYWYWCRYFIDIYNECPMRCNYCNTRKSANIKGFTYIDGLPPRREIVGLGLRSDIYHPDDSKNGIVANILEILLDRGYAVNIQTKSHHIAQNMGLLSRFARRKMVRITFTLLTLDRELSRMIEGSSTDPYDRLGCLGELTREGIPTGIAITPIIPYLNDDEQSLTMLIREAKKRGAGWVLFSGFSPISSFLRHPLLKQTASLYTQPDLLSLRYRKIKGHMVELLQSEAIPFRIPRIHADPIDRRHITYIVSEYLFNISYLYELLENGIEARRYRRAAHRINDFEHSLKAIVFKKKLGYIKGINPDIEKVIEEIVYNGSTQLYEDLKEKLFPRATYVEEATH